MLYEINYLVLQSNSEKLVEIRKSLKELIASLGGEIKEEKEFLKRKLAYEIKNEGYGFHTVLRFEIENSGENIDQLKKKLNLSSKVARYVIVNAKELPLLKDLFAREQEEKERIQRDTIKQEDVGKFLAQEKKAVSAEALATKTEKDKEVKEPAEEKAEEVEKSEEKKEEVVSDKEEKKEENKKDEKTGKISLDDLDEKLDEILNI